MKRSSSLILIVILILGMLAPCAQAASYTTHLTAAIDIYSGPGYDYRYLRDVGEDGIYTIVEEALCEDGLIWGRLKSGAGWVMLRSAYLDESYTLSLDGATELYEGPGYGYRYAGIIGESGVYTIVAEMSDGDGNPWGKLKSGAGWVMLDRVLNAADSYTTELGGWVTVFDGPGYDYPYVCTIGEDGIYTIVEERIDDEGSLWGRLKSGIGWVDLSLVRRMGRPVITANYADGALLEAGGCTIYNMDEDDDLTLIAFRAHEYLRNVKLFLVEHRDDAYVATEKLYGFSRFYEDTPFVAGLCFWGDLTTYGISFTDESGCERSYLLSISGRTGMPMLEEYPVG